ncbi:hypothetical protein G7Y89_g7953 [Cudoniella acicularis]|uniref:Uncharacterized protein n=1 Tax=Cudoniella acicularis TaxID=354080 RepID=A0A8H4RJT4_9HELO|nr:hypothetical protein G7Y89_g7953 [Cudoniella acicularis]
MPKKDRGKNRPRIHSRNNTNNTEDDDRGAQGPQNPPASRQIAGRETYAAQPVPHIDMPSAIPQNPGMVVDTVYLVRYRQVDQVIGTTQGGFQPGPAPGSAPSIGGSAPSTQPKGNDNKQKNNGKSQPNEPKRDRSEIRRTEHGDYAKSMEHLEKESNDHPRRICSNCKREDHYLNRCVGPVDSCGFIPGCFYCGGMNHILEGCEHFDKFHPEYLARAMLKFRQNKPPFQCTLAPQEHPLAQPGKKYEKKPAMDQRICIGLCPGAPRLLENIPPTDMDSQKVKLVNRNVKASRPAPPAFKRPRSPDGIDEEQDARKRQKYDDDVTMENSGAATGTDTAIGPDPVGANEWKEHQRKRAETAGSAVHSVNQPGGTAPNSKKRKTEKFEGSPESKHIRNFRSHSEAMNAIIDNMIPEGVVNVQQAYYQIARCFTSSKGIINYDEFLKSGREEWYCLVSFLVLGIDCVDPLEAGSRTCEICQGNKVQLCVQVQRQMNGVKVRLVDTARKSTDLPF